MFFSWGKFRIWQSKQFWTRKSQKTKYSLILNPDTKLAKNTLDNFLISSAKNNNFAIMAPINGQSFSKNLIMKN